MSVQLTSCGFCLSLLSTSIYLHISDNEGHQTRLPNLKNAGDLPKPRDVICAHETHCVSKMQRLLSGAFAQQLRTPSRRSVRPFVRIKLNSHRTNSRSFYNLLTKSKFLKSDKRDDITYEHRHIFLTTSGTHVSRVANIPGAATSHTLLMLLARCRKANAPKVFCASDISYSARFHASAAM